MPAPSVTMSNTQLQRFEVLSSLIGGSINGSHASEKLGLSVRHIYRLKRRVQIGGAHSLLHGNAGRESPHKVSASVREKILKLCTSTYKGFGPTFAAEKLLERDDIQVSSEWLRGFLIKNNLWKPKARRTEGVHREWRPRMELEGAMEQFDGSYHHWIPGLDEEQCLLLSIDDATGKITKAHFAYHEGIVPVFTFWKEYGEEHQRLPKRLYVDKFSTYKVNHKHAVDEPTMHTQFERVLKELGVELICAHSPQAKGRVERNFGTQQDRLVKELGLAGVRNIEEANEFLKTYIPIFNERFAVPAAKEGNAFVPIPASIGLERVFSVQTPRKVLNDFTVRFENGWYQIGRVQSSTVLPRDTVTVERRLDGTVHMRLARTDQYLNIEVLPERPKPLKRVYIIPASTRTPYKPAKNHPWGYRARHPNERVLEKV